MNTPQQLPDEPAPADVPTPSRDAANWAKPTGRLALGEVPDEAVNLNVTGRKVQSPVQGFGKMWQKTYRVSVPKCSPTALIAEWKAHFSSFWPAKNNFYGPLTSLAPGDVALLNLTMPGRLKLSTGILVIYADDESFSFMSPQGHMFAGMITFCGLDAEMGSTAQVQVLIRASDPLYELGLTFGGHRQEDKFWAATLTNLAKHFGVDEPYVETTMLCVDKKRQWRNAGNVRHNAMIRSALYGMTAPFRLLARPFRRRKPAKS